MVRPVGVICLKRMHGDEQWLLSLGDVAGEVALAWPTIATAKEGATSFAVDFQKAPLRLCIVDPHEWQGVRVRWISPVEQLLRGWCTCEDLCARPELLLVAETPAEPLLLLAAKNAFWDLPMHMVAWIASQLEVNLDVAETEAEKVLVLVKHLLPGVAEPELFEMLSRRSEVRDDQLADLLAMPAFEEFVHEADAAGFAEAQDGEEKKKSQRASYASQVHQLIAKLTNAATKRKQATALRTNLGKRFVSELPSGILSRVPRQGVVGRGGRGSGERDFYHVGAGSGCKERCRTGCNMAVRAQGVWAAKGVLVTGAGSGCREWVQGVCQCGGRRHSASCPRRPGRSTSTGSTCATKAMEMAAV